MVYLCGLGMAGSPVGGGSQVGPLRYMILIKIQIPPVTFLMHMHGKITPKITMRTAARLTFSPQ